MLPATHYAVKRGRPDPIVAGMRLREAEAPTPFEPTKSLRGGVASRAWDEVESSLGRASGRAVGHTQLHFKN